MPLKVSTLDTYSNCGLVNMAANDKGYGDFHCHKMQQQYLASKQARTTTKKHH